MLKRQSSLKNEKGMAVFEMIPIIVVIVLFLNFSIGFFGAIHTGILNSIASRNYAFETFRNRADLTYFRGNDGEPLHFAKEKMRVHGTLTEKTLSSRGDTNWKASSRLIDFMEFDNRAADVVGTQADHNKTRSIPEGRNTTVGVNPIWIRTTYGICLNSTCGT
ncbi:hypothetical protein [Bdellovibrio sp. BCCA]|uniref:hypothetical protein n=1 Tax=Bdellovibrio sp. BCCA TaxID=3136281 RepID=UPI0030F2CD71